MRTVGRSKYHNPKYAQVWKWGKFISVTGSAQVLVQVLGLVSGLLIIRLLSVQEYALYTLANAMLATLTVLSDAGISTGVMAEGGKVWDNKEKLGAVMVTGLYLREKMAIFSLVVAMPVLLYLLLYHGASLVMSCLIVLSLIPAFYAALSDSLLEIPPKLNQAIGPLQKNQIEANAGRFFLTIFCLFIFPYAFVAVFAAGATRIAANYKLRRISKKFADFEMMKDLHVQSNIGAVVKKVLPGAIYYCLSAQITIWLLSIFGSSDSIAKVGAIGRLMMVLTVISSLFSHLVVPRFAKFPNNARLLTLRFFQLLFILLCISALPISFVYFFPAKVLWVLGEQYSGLSTEVFLMTVSSCIGMVVGIIYSATTARGLILSPVVNICGHIITQIFFVLSFDMSNIYNVLLLTVADCSIAFLMLSTNFLYQTIRMKNRLVWQKTI